MWNTASLMAHCNRESRRMRRIAVRCFLCAHLNEKERLS